MNRLLGRTQWCVVALVLLAWRAPSVSADPIYSSVVLADNPVGYWRLGQTPAQTTAFDSSPFGRHGTYVGGVTRSVPGAIVDDPNTAARFDGSTGSVIIPDGAPFNFANNFTLEAWVINNNDLSFHRILSNGVQGYGFGVFNARLLFTTFGILDYFSDVILPTDGQYHHVVVTFDSGNDANYYLDGVFRQTIAGTLPAQSSALDLRIGRNPAGPAQFWNGTIDEAAIYNYVLTGSQIAAHYQAGIAAIPEPSALTLLGLGTLSLLGCAWQRRTRPRAVTAEPLYGLESQEGAPRTLTE